SALRGGRIARLMLMNGLLLLSTLAVAFIGAKYHKDPTTVAVFGLVALAQAACGLILLILSIFERPKGIASLAFRAGVSPGGVGGGVGGGGAGARGGGRAVACPSASARSAASRS